MENLEQFFDISGCNENNKKYDHYIIYLTTNLINNKKYVGMHIVNKRHLITDGYLGSGILISKAIKKNKKENFKREILEHCYDMTMKEIGDIEENYICYFDTRNPEIGYNIGKGGWGGDFMTNNPNLKEIGKKISNSNIGKKDSEETRKRKSDSATGKIFSDLTINRIKETKIKNGTLHISPTKETRKIISNKLIGSKRTKESIIKQQATRKQNKENAIKLGLSYGRQDYTFSEETKQKQRNSHKKYIEKCKDLNIPYGTKGKSISKEHSNKISNSLKIRNENNRKLNIPHHNKK